LSDDDAAIGAARSYRKRLAEYARMSPLEVWYARIDHEDYLSLVTDPSWKKRELKAIAKANGNLGLGVGLSPPGRYGQRQGPQAIGRLVRRPV